MVPLDHLEYLHEPKYTAEDAYSKTYFQRFNQYCTEALSQKKINTVLFLKLFNFHNILLYAVRLCFFFHVINNLFLQLKRDNFENEFLRIGLGGGGELSLIVQHLQRRKIIKEKKRRTLKACLTCSLTELRLRGKQSGAWQV